jgi:2,4-diaminopentanoate dehydrogenase
MRSLHIGVSTIGQEVIKACLSRNTAIPSAAVDINPDMVGKPLSDFVPGVAPDAFIYGSLDEALAAGPWDIAVLCTASSLPAIRTDLDKLIAQGLDVVSTAEELAYPALQHPDVFAELDEAAAKSGATVVGTGVNPCFVLDLLPVLLTRPCVEVNHVHCARIVNTMRRRKQLQLKLGAGIEAAEFEQRKAAGKIGHVGLLESAALVARGLGWPVAMDNIEHTLEPVIAEQPISSEYVSVSVGQVLGAEERIKLAPTSDTSIELHLRMRLGEPEEYDEVRIDGVPPLLMRIEGGIHGDAATAGCTANIMAQTLKAPPGLLTVLDLPLA